MSLPSLAGEMSLLGFTLLPKPDDLTRFKISDLVKKGEILYRAIDWLVSLAGLVAIIYIIYGGFQYLTSAGSDEKAASGKQTAIWATIGLAVVIVSKLIIAFFLKQAGVEDSEILNF